MTVFETPPKPWGKKPKGKPSKRPGGRPKCQFWLGGVKQRTCHFEAVAGRPYCGNHLFQELGEGARRVPCTVDPTHEVIEGTMEVHLKICPTVVRLAKAAAQAHFRAGCNAGPASEAVPYPSADQHSVSPECLPSSSGAVCNGAGLATISGGVHQSEEMSQNVVNASRSSAPEATAGGGLNRNDPAAQASRCSGDEPGEAARDSAAEAEGGAVRGGTGGRKLALGAALAWRLAPAALAQLLAKIEAAHAQECVDAMPGIPQELLAEGAQLQQDDPLRPFSLKHARQQASIVGHMQRAGLLTDVEEAAGVELGCGTAYLANAVVDCSGLQRMVLVDSGHFRHKADRTMRHIQVTRLRCGIQDFWPPGVPLLRVPSFPSPLVTVADTEAAAPQTVTQPPAPDPGDISQPSHAQAAQAGKAAEGSAPLLTAGHSGAHPPQSILGDPHTAALASTVQRGTRPLVLFGKHLCGAATDFSLRCAQQCLSSGGGSLRGLCVATCCHHRCEWQHYVGRDLFRRCGFSPQEFAIISWMTGWALCGHEAPDLPPDAEVDGTDDHDTGRGLLSDLSRGRRVAVGMQCKALIDRGRVLWLRSLGLQVEYLAYVPQDVSGENKLIMATA